MHRFVLIGLSGSGKTTQVELRYGLNSGANMDDPPGTGPSAEEMLRWIRRCSKDLVNMSVHHRGILELARMAQEMPEQLGDMTFIYLEAREEVLRNRLRGRNDEIRRFSKVKSLAVRLDICPRTIFRWADQGMITRHKINARVVLFDDAEVVAFIESARVG